MKRNPVVAIWIVGIVVAILAYELGPNHFLTTVMDLVETSFHTLERWLYELSHAAINLIRAAAIGLYVVFVALSILVIRKSGQARSALILISIAFFLLIGGGAYDVSNDRWFAAFLIAAVGAAIMTRRLA